MKTCPFCYHLISDHAIEVKTGDYIQKTDTYIDYLYVICGNDACDDNSECFNLRDSDIIEMLFDIRQKAKEERRQVLG
jgi:hypothetical protein